MEVNPEVEKKNYHLLSWRELEQRGDPEALYEMGYRRRFGVCVMTDEVEAWRLTIAAAQQGHPISIALCYAFGKGVPLSVERSVELYKQGAERCYAPGILPRALCVALLD